MWNIHMPHKKSFWSWWTKHTIGKKLKYKWSTLFSFLLFSWNFCGPHSTRFVYKRKNNLCSNKNVKRKDNMWLWVVPHLNGIIIFAVDHDMFRDSVRIGGAGIWTLRVLNSTMIQMLILIFERKQTVFGCKIDHKQL